MTVEYKNLESAAPSVAELIIEDTIFSAHTNPEMNGDATVQDALDLMEGPRADVVVQDIMAPGLGARLTQRFKGAPFRFTAKELKKELIGGLQRYLELPSEERRIFQQKIIKQREIANYKKKDGRDWYLNFDHFWMNLPAEDEDDPNIIHHRNMAKLTGRLDLTYAEKPEHANTSPLKLSQTRKEFFSTIDSAIVEEGIDIDEVRRWKNEKTTEELYELVTPVFINLRVRGYTEEDLVT